MIYAAEVISAGILNPDAFIVQPKYKRIDGVDALTIEALPINGLFPSVGDIVFCAEGINDFDQETQLIINDNGGAYPLIFATLASPIIYKIDMTLLGKMVLGEGTFKMVLGDDLQTWAQAKDAEIAALYAWAKTGTGASGSIPAFPGTPVEKNWNTATLSENHKLD